jgi:hypothetical protein
MPEQHPGSANSGLALFLVRLLREGLIALPLTAVVALLVIPAIFALPVVGELGGIYVGAKVGSQGLDKAAMLLGVTSEVAHYCTLSRKVAVS